MPLELQVKLLRVLETGEVTRIGGTQPKSVNVRLISATNRDPAKAVAAGKLREDLLYRLHVFPIEMPPLRSRGDDVDLMAAMFVDALNRRYTSAKRLSPEAIERLRSHSWPGNVRELKNVLERAYIMARERIEATDIPLERRSTPQPADNKRIQFPVGTSLEETEKALILATLAHHGGNKREAAETLGVSLKTLYNRLKEYGAEDVTPTES
jgi:DNA-binding NtrC family response regulator